MRPQACPRPSDYLLLPQIHRRVDAGPENLASASGTPRLEKPGRREHRAALGEGGLRLQVRPLTHVFDLAVGLAAELPEERVFLG